MSMFMWNRGPSVSLVLAVTVACSAPSADLAESDMAYYRTSAALLDLIRSRRLWERFRADKDKTNQWFIELANRPRGLSQSVVTVRLPSRKVAPFRLPPRGIRRRGPHVGGAGTCGVQRRARLLGIAMRRTRVISVKG